MPPSRRSSPVFGETLAAIDVGTNAVRLEVARSLPDGSLETLHQERDPVRPGEGLFSSGLIRPEVADRLLATLRRYAALCRRHGARVRAVATSAVREARNREEIVRRVRREAALSLEVVSGKEEARLICLGVLHGKPALARSLCVDIGGGSTEIAFAHGDVASQLWSLPLGAVRLAEQFGAAGVISPKRLRLLRQYAAEGVARQLPKKIPRAPKLAYGSSGTIGAVVSFAADGAGQVSASRLSRAVEALAQLSPEKRRRRLDPQRADIVPAGAVILEAVVRHLGLESITAVSAGLREGILFDLVDRERPGRGDRSMADAAAAIGQRFQWDEPHARHVTALALSLFDDLAALHKLPASARPLLEVAALLHDIGNAVSFQRHHKHTYYLIQNADIPGLTDREREVVGRIARYHRRSAPDAAHGGMTGLTPSESRLVRRCATLLRLADSLDASHHQPLKEPAASVRGGTVHLRLTARAAPDLELWDVAREAPLFRQVFGRRLTLHVDKAAPRNR